MNCNLVSVPVFNLSKLSCLTFFNYISCVWMKLCKIERIINMSSFVIGMCLMMVEIVALIIMLVRTIVCPIKKNYIPLIWDIITIIITYSLTPVPKPEIYPSNGQVIRNGVVKIEAERGLQIYYTLDAYADPATNTGKRMEYVGPIKLDQSVTLNVKTCFWGKWSELVTLDMVVQDDSEPASAKLNDMNCSGDGAWMTADSKELIGLEHLRKMYKQSFFQNIHNIRHHRINHITGSHGNWCNCYKTSFFYSDLTNKKRKLDIEGIYSKYGPTYYQENKVHIFIIEKKNKKKRAKSHKCRG